MGHELTLLPCLLCEFQNEFLGVDAWEAHLLRDHFQQLPWVCDTCGGRARFPIRAQLVDHYERGHGMTDYEVGLFQHSCPLACI